uniref:RNA-directed DNA polymerase, eukaryota, reverse transcriptase zinc-binding domain protein n=1 Tax=Tanacetum cinerariifolium TaxID=118510 RepID=A0A6L2MTE2_TANCI|nr:RNA-directed DNA polymerase, eukaryota, reverse transcriptase zinc-binding domain protein [Tanacetum cinerariifolium]
MSQIDANKAPGPDGYYAAFFKKLVPKIQTPLKVSDFRPIACRNVIYKCISKVLTERLKGCLDKLRCGYFKGEMGLKHGDHISPYLFTLVIEILTLIIKRNGCKKLKVTNVFFADDLLMFCHADKSSLKVLKESIDEFGKVAGLIPNYNKSTIIFGSLDDEEKKDLLEVMPFKVEKLPIRYLGVPLTSKRLRAKKCKHLLDKVESRGSSWKNKCISYAGRLMLVAYVLETIHV